MLTFCSCRKEHPDRSSVTQTTTEKYLADAGWIANLYRTQLGANH